ncbi:hydroxymethylbilane synthase [Spirillospora sp. CA-253888]
MFNLLARAPTALHGSVIRPYGLNHQRQFCKAFVQLPQGLVYCPRVRQILIGSIPPAARPDLLTWFSVTRSTTAKGSKTHAKRGAAPFSGPTPGSPSDRGRPDSIEESERHNGNAEMQVNSAARVSTVTDLVPTGHVDVDPAFSWSGGGGTLRLGTRTSPLAMTQARYVAGRLRAMANVEIEIVGIETAGDRHKGHLGGLGGKGAFMREIDRALLTGRVDIAVHCLKDVPGDVPRPDGLAFAAYVEREDTADVMLFPIASKVQSLADLPAGALVGTSAVRRRAQLGQIRPDLRVEYLRGNVNSRLGRLDAGDSFDAIVLAKVSLTRMGIDRPGEVLDILPAVGSGVLAVDCRTRDADIVELVRLLDHRETRRCITAERTMLHGLQGHCNSPIAAHARLERDGQLGLRAMVFTRDGSQFVHSHEWAPSDKAADLGAYVAGDLLRKGARDLIDGIPH